MELLTQIEVGLNAVANFLGRCVLAAIAVWPDWLLDIWPGWLSATLIAIVSGVLFLIAFKYTSPQRAIKRVKDDIKANLLALKLFKDSARVALRAQGSILYAALRLLLFSLVPMVVMIVPVLLIWGQIALWYQYRPLRLGEDAVVTLKLNPGSNPIPSNIELGPSSATETTVGPVRVGSKHEVCWNIRAVQSGYHRLVFHVGNQTVEKELAIGDGFMRVSKLRPGRNWYDVLVNPWEKPFNSDSPVQSIEIDYPDRSAWPSGTSIWMMIKHPERWHIMTCGTDTWVIYWLLVSLIAGFCFRRPLHVNF
jgi:hypothetical protein